MKDLESAQAAGVAPWDLVAAETDTYVIYQDRFPVTPGHLLFVPRVNYIDNILDCYRAAHRLGDWLVLKGDADAYNVGMNRGAAAGQTVMYPHVHMIPRRSGDCADPVGGVRAVISGQANYKTDTYQNPDK
jgi:diadenosine tetraphosphate (Ap4A) HIT family hydrolase